MISIPFVTVTDPDPWSTVSVSPLARFRLLTVIDTRELFSTSVNWKFDVANVFAVSSFVVTLLFCATGTSLTAMILMFIVAETVPVSASFPVKENVLSGVPFAFVAGV